MNKKFIILISILMVVIVCVVAVVINYKLIWPAKTKPAYTEETVMGLKHTFKTETGTEWDTGLGVKVSIPPSQTKGKAELAVKQFLPEQFEEEFIKIHSAYDISMVWVRNTSKHPPATLSFEIPENIDPRAAVILQQTEEGWVIAECLEGIPGGTVSPDGKYISIIREQMSIYAIYTWEPPEFLVQPPIITVKDTKPSSLYPSHLTVEVSLESPAVWGGLEGMYALGGTWYRIDISGTDHIKVEGSGDGYLGPGKKRDLEITFPNTGGHATLCLNSIGALPRATLNWANRLGVPVSEMELMLETMERFQNRPGDLLSDDQWVVFKLLLELIWRVLGPEVKFYVNLAPVASDITVYYLALVDSRPDTCVVVSAEATIEGDKEIVEEPSEETKKIESIAQGCSYTSKMIIKPGCSGEITTIKIEVSGWSKVAGADNFSYYFHDGEGFPKGDLILETWLSTNEDPFIRTYKVNLQEGIHGLIMEGCASEGYIALECCQNAICNFEVRKCH